MDAIQTIYIALFGRPADPLGLDYFVDLTNDGADLSAIGDLANQAEYQDRFVGMNNQQIITSIYQSLFGRNPEQAGLEYFLNELNSGRQNINTIAINIAHGAKGDDLATLNNKIAAANEFTAAINTPDALAAYVGNDAADQGRAFLAGITADPATIPNAAAVEAAIDAIILGPVGETFTLTTAVGENVIGTSANDTFNVILGSGQTLNDFDKVDGNGGHDIMNIKADGNLTAAIPASASIKGVETINFSNTGVSGTIDAARFVGAKVINQTGNSVADVSGLANGQTVGFADVEADVTLKAANGTTSINVALDGALNDSDITFEGNAVSTVNVSGSMEDDGKDLYLYDDTNNSSSKSTIKTLNISLSTDTDVSLWGTHGFDELVTFNASGGTGGIEVDLWGLDKLATATFGSGDDYVDVSIGKVDLTVNLGAGSDEIWIDASHNTVNAALKVTLGAGSDYVGIYNISNIADASDANFAKGLVTITDFSTAAGGDVLDLSSAGLSFQTLINTQVSAITNADSLFDAVELAAGYLAGANDSVAFNFGGNAYIFHDANAGGGFNDGDGLIELAGVSVANFSAANYIV